MDLITNVAIALIAIGSFIGQTRYALHSVNSRLEKLESLFYTSNARLAAIESHLKGSAVVE